MEWSSWGRTRSLPFVTLSGRGQSISLFMRMPFFRVATLEERRGRTPARSRVKSSGQSVGEAADAMGRDEMALLAGLQWRRSLPPPEAPEQFRNRTDRKRERGRPTLGVGRWPRRGHGTEKPNSSCRTSVSSDSCLPAIAPRCRSQCPSFFPAEPPSSWPSSTRLRVSNEVVKPSRSSCALSRPPWSSSIVPASPASRQNRDTSRISTSMPPRITLKKTKLRASANSTTKLMQRLAAEISSMSVTDAHPFR